MESSEIRKGLVPQPPKLQKSARRWTPSELFWIIKNGVKMTAMPAWGPTHSAEKIWSMVAFLQKLPDMTPVQYKEMDRQAGPGECGAGADAD
jgi:mono/diheme cytochrome c family protein